MICPNSFSPVPLNTPQKYEFGERKVKCSECGQMVAIYADGKRYRRVEHEVPIPDEPLLCDNEWIAEVMWD